MNIINFSLLGRNNKILKSDLEKKENSTEKLENGEVKDITTFEEVLEMKKEEIKEFAKLDNSEMKIETQQIKEIEEVNEIKEVKNEKEIVALDQSNNESMTSLNASKTNSTDYYTNQSSMVIRNQFLYDYLNGNKTL